MRHETFCLEYAIDLNGSAAYRRAFPKVRTDDAARTGAAKLLAKVSVRERVAELQLTRAEHTGTTQEWVLERLKREAEFEGKGASHAARVSALALVMKYLGMFKQGPAPARAPIDLSKIPDDLKRALLAGLRAVRGVGPPD
ncbi:terminase small subunit [Gemmata sp. G18]|uniref:Terminase small subunit n=1 Tax=Gemmata palustris TaxID=2822762 RepID=A0ABS5BSQ4_9BACT|nr:terminase small subunit [Gemmata palustris]MBP3956300.1 terminase small subunit [Gemmata palustris]